MGRIITGESVRRAYSYLGLDRAYHRGFGIGVLAPGWDPMSAPCGVQSGDSFVPWRIPGCAAAYCSNSAVYGTVVHLTGGNVDTFYDLSGNGRHLLQAVAGSQPLWVASGSGGALRFTSAGSDYMKTAPFALNQPEHFFLLAKWTSTAGNTVILDGNADGTGYLYRGPAPAMLSRLLAGVAGPGVTPVDATWNIYDGLFNGASSAIGLNGGVVVTGNAGANNMGGITLCASGASVLFATADVAALVVYSAAQAEPNRQRVIRWMRRQGQMLGVL